jgi:dienelactone hydrolase
VAAGLTVAGVALGQALAPAAEVNDPLADLRTHVEAHEFVAAFEEARELEATHGGQPEFEALRTAATLPVTVRTDRDSVRVSVKDYTRPDAAWIPLGYAPLDSVRVPAALLRWRLEGPEGAVVERAAMGAYLTDTLRFALPDQPAPPGMLQVTGDAPNPGAPRRMALEPFWMDRFEVSNAEFAPFVASGGYTRLEALAAADAQPAGVRFASSPVRRFTDRTGMPGPSTWTSGGYPPETADRPVTGVSWYEAAAYCAWAGKELPTVYHWYDAGGYHGFSDILTQSNFSEAGLADRGSTPGIGPYGHRDLAGNAREWAANTTGPDGGLRFALGGAWDEPHYLYWQPDAIDPMDRSARNGFRCARLRESTSHRSREPVSAGTPDASEREPVSDREFSWILGHYEHDDTPLRGQVEGSGVDGRGLRWQDVSFEPAYEGSRVSARIFLPSSGPAPHSAIVFHPGAEARHLPSPDLLHTWWFAYLVRSGHAVIVPAFKGTLGRQAETAGPIAARDQIVQRIQDLRRTVDYLGTRSDIDSDRIGFMGFSEGGVIAPLAVAADARLRGAIVVSAGLPRRALDPVIDPVNFLPRARTPLLFIGSAHDFIFPPRRSQEPFVELWGTPGSMKTTVTLPGGHAPSDMEPIVMAVLPWLRSTFGAGVATEEAPTP